MTERIDAFLRQRRQDRARQDHSRQDWSGEGGSRDDGPCLVVDLDVVAENYRAFAGALPDTRVFYAVKANPAPEILELLARLGSCFDAASVSEVEAVLAAGATPERISLGSTIKKERDIARAFALGVRHFAFDSEAEVDKLSRAAPGSRVSCRLLVDNAGADWPLSRKFGCDEEMAVELLERAHRLGLVAHGVSFHVGSQQRDPTMWDGALAISARVFRACAERGVPLAMVNLGGGFPARYLKKVPSVRSYGDTIFGALRKHFGNDLPETVIEPGRGLVGDAGIIEAEVVLISRKSKSPDEIAWVYLDIGKFGGLAETADEAIRYPIRTARDGDAKMPCALAGPTCDSVDVLYEKEPYWLPVSIEIGDKLLIEGTGAYTTTYASVGFNGFPPLKQYVI